MRTWQITGERAGKLREGSGLSTSAFTRTSCGKPWVSMPKYPACSAPVGAWKITIRVRLDTVGRVCPNAPSNDTTGTLRPPQLTRPAYHGGALVISAGG